MHPTMVVFFQSELKFEKKVTLVASALADSNFASIVFLDFIGVNPQSDP